MFTLRLLQFNVQDFKTSACKARRGLTRGVYGPPFEKISDASRLAKGCKSQILVSQRMLRTPRHCLFEVLIDHFTVVGLVTWALNGSEAGVGPVLLKTSLLLLSRSSCSYAN